MYRKKGDLFDLGSLNVQYARLRKLKLTEKGVKKYGFALMACGREIILLAPSKILQLIWVRALRKSCILMEFRRDYRVEAPIGRGGFSTVHLCQQKGTLK